MTTQLIDSLWERLAGVSIEALRMSDAEAARFRSNRVAKLVGLLPFLAGCDDAERTALAHLAVFAIAGRGEARRVFDHSPADDAEPLARLRTIADFKGGQRAVIDRGMAMLGLCMVSGYRRDAEPDRILGAYNPVNADTGKAAGAESAFRKTIAGTQPTEVDAILSVDEAATGFWQG
ncbi:MAG: hypothetical protein KKA67_01455 [Spirochaetes bacterium]|nr:hypothetical protein [Spirochaetota bacterium]MBU1079243.1 hypothetical protein [Spirochaetota bacterium]